MKLHVLKAGNISGTAYSIPDWSIAEQQGHKIDSNNPDAIVSMSISKMAETEAVIERYPEAKLFCYNWDCYEWVWTNPRPGEYDYKRYGELLKLADEIWVPSRCTGERTTQWWNHRHWHTVLSCCKTWEHDNIRDDGYALCCLREIPDRNWGLFERCCEELDIPYKMPKHEATFEQYKDLVAGCRFICSPLHELSTGGLSILEAYYHGKPVLMNNSHWHGGKDYLGDRATYFSYRNLDDFKTQLKRMHKKPKLAPNHEYVRENFSDQVMVNNMLERIKLYL